ncbi:MAG TPA: type ISP restriction/modification enzyme [Anaerolineales bacterium]|jgi:type I restriction-modification system DNA methylase subunit
MPTSFDIYISKIEADLRGGHATEYTYRSSLEHFMESLERGIDASNDPKHIECGAPDFIVERGKVPLGYVETKDIGVSLDKIEKSDQMKRYLQALNNLILTDYLEFRWYVNGEKKLTLKVAEVGPKNRLLVSSNAQENLAQLFQSFYATEAPTVNSPKELAKRLAGVTHFIRDQIIAALTSGDADLQKALNGRYTAFRELLLPALKPEEFGDLYAQAMTYGLFAAKLSAPEGEKFTLAGAYQFLFGNKFLRRLFSDVSEELDEIDIIRPYLQDIVSLLNRADFHSILADFGKRTRTEDPVVHFYETFLAAYDPKLRESRGVYYTPEPVVQFIVRSVDELLKTHFDKPWGLADASVKVLDPATGTGTFLYYVIQQIHEEVVSKRKQAGMWAQKSKELLNRIFGFELLIAPYVVSHLKLGLLLKTLGRPLEGRDERLHVYLTNTLEEGVTRAEQLAGLGSYIAEEASDAAHVKKQADIMVVLGNPPYSNFGMLNKSEWILGLLDDYKKDLNEKKINLDDDYIKFIRFGQWRIEKTGQGILAFITNNSFLDGVTHRRMRQSLMETFSDIYILNLHGNTKKHEKTSDGADDKNVFDIQQGVSINILIKQSNKKGKGDIKYFDLWGNRERKYEYLSSINLSDVNWQVLEHVERNSCLGILRFFTPMAFDNIDEYCMGWSVKDIFITKQNALKTDRDELVFDFDNKPLEDRIKLFYTDAGLKSPFKESFNIENSSSYDLLGRRQNTKFNAENIQKCLYRPFDVLWLYYSPNLTSRPAWDVMKHMISGKNLGLITTRTATDDWDCFVTENLCGHKSCAAYDINSLFPLYLYTTAEETAGTLFAQTETTRSTNLAAEFVKALGEKLALEFIPDGSGDSQASFGPEDEFYYAYAFFHSPTYRSRYAEFLKIDFPRLPLTSNKDLFFALAGKGKELVELHLLKTPKVDDFITSYPVAGDNRVEKVVFANGIVWINNHQYFGNVPEQVWNFKVGGYQVCEKWLKDRKGRILSGEDISHYQRVVVALQETIRLMSEIDKVIPNWPIA